METRDREHVNDARPRIAVAHLRQDLMLVGDQERLCHRRITPENAFYRAGRASARLPEQRCTALFGGCSSFFTSRVSGGHRGQQRGDQAGNCEKSQRREHDIAAREPNDQHEAGDSQTSRAKAGEPGQ